MENLKIIIFYGGDSATKPREQLLNWLRTPRVKSILQRQIDVRKVSNWTADGAYSVHDRVAEAISWADKALVMFTPDSRGEYGAPNVLEEFGRWVSRKPTGTMVVLRHKDVPVHSNAAGLVYLRFHDDVVQECGEAILAFLQYKPDSKLHLQVSSLLPEQAVSQPKVSLPNKTYHRLIGRNTIMRDIMESLRKSDKKPILEIVSLGGMGKTAIAREVAEIFSFEKVFDYIIWTSAKSELFEGEKIVQRRLTNYGLDNVLNDIGRGCERLDIPQMPPDQKNVAVEYLLHNYRVLIILDNVETISDPDHLVSALFSILGQSKLLITSRHLIRHEQAKVVRLPGLEQNASITFLQEEGHERGIDDIAEADYGDLIKIHDVTGGAPLAMKLVVGQIYYSPLEKVLETLKMATFSGQDYDFYHFVYRHSWEMLDIHGQMALVDMSRFPPNSGGAKELIEQMSDMDSDTLWLSMGRLVVMSLVSKIGLGETERYALHSLTQYFVKSDITKEWIRE